MDNSGNRKIPQDVNSAESSQDQSKEESFSIVPKCGIDKQAGEEPLSKTQSVSSTSSEPFVKEYPANSISITVRYVTSDEEEDPQSEEPLQKSSSESEEEVTRPAMNMKCKK